MGIALTSIGIKISYAVETTAGTRPTTGYHHLPDLSSSPDTNQSPNTEDATTFDNLTHTSYVEVLKDWGGAVPLDANFTNELATAWKAARAAYEALSGDKKMWFCVDIPDYDNGVYFKGAPSPWGVPATNANGKISTQVYIIPDGDPVEATKPTYATANTSNPSNPS